MIQKVFFCYGNGVQGSFCACAQPMRDHVTLWCCLSLAGHMHKMISRGIFALKNLYNNRSKNSGIAMHELLVLIVCLWTPYGIAKLGNYCFSFLVCCLFGAVPLNEPMQTYCIGSLKVVVLQNTLKWDLNRNGQVFFEENGFGKVMCMIIIRASKSLLLLSVGCTVYSKKYAHGFCFAVLCCGYTLTDFPISIRLTSLALWQSNDCPSASKATLMNMDKYFMWIHYERLHNHNKAKHNKTVCIFLGIYCMLHKLQPKTIMFYCCDVVF